MRVKLAAAAALAVIAAAGCGGSAHQAEGWPGGQARVPVSTTTTTLPVADTSPGVVFLQADDGRFVVSTAKAGGPSHLLVSTDLVHWRDITPPPLLATVPAGFGGFPGTQDGVIDVSFDGAVGLAVICNQNSHMSEIYRTADNGGSWQQIADPAQGSDRCQEAVQLLSPTQVIFNQPEAEGGIGGTTLDRSTDGGQSWSTVYVAGRGTGPFITPVVYADADHAFSAGGPAEGTGTSSGSPAAGYFQSSTDGGSTWTTSEPPDAGGTAVDYGLPTFTGPNSGLLEAFSQMPGGRTVVQFDTTSNGGGSWAKTSTVTAGTDDVDPMVSTPTADLWWVASQPTTEGSTAPGTISVTADGGAAWHAVAPKGLPGDTAQLVALSATTAVALVLRHGVEVDPEPGDLYRTVDGGVTWTQLPLPQA